VSGVAGVLYKPTPKLGVGFTYNRGAVFDVETRLFGDFLFTIPTVPPQRIDVTLSGQQRDVNYVVPDRYTAGVSWRARNDLTLLSDVSRVNYSQQVTDKFLVADFQDPAAGITPKNFYIRDVYATHAGVEWRRYGSRSTVSFRGGVFTDPSHPLRFQSGGNDPTHPADALLKFRFNTSPTRTDVGVTAGGGLTLANRLQVDGAISVVRDAVDVVASMVVRFK